MQSFTKLKKNLKSNFSSLKKVKIALLGDTATQFLNQALRGTGYDSGFDLEIWEADFNQIDHQIFDSDSEMYAYNPDVIIIFQSTHKLLAKYNKLKPDQYSNLAENFLEDISTIRNKIQTKLAAKIIYYNYPEIDDAVFGNFGSKIEPSFIFQLRKINYHLALHASINTNFFLCDISGIQNQVGKSIMFQPSVYINTEMVLSIDILPQVASRTFDIIKALNGKFKKCLILDLDNTIWGGIIGDDGLENIQIGSLGIGKAFSEFQYWIKKLKNRGIIIAVCSKNTESIAMEPFQHHPDMILHMDDIAVFVANLDNKADNIKHIQRTLNIGYDSMVFLDDNPFERNIVRQNIPDITVPELPEDPADYLEFLYTLNLFETVNYSNEDLERTKHYQNEAQRTAIKDSFINESEFLQNLNMISLVAPFNKFNIPRASQLSQRSNQFNLRTVRYTDEEIKIISEDANYYTLSFTLHDHYGDNGLICIIILKIENHEALFIDTWLMSCRVLKRGMEEFTLNTIANFALKNGYTFLRGEYLPTAKNEMVKDHYENLGFQLSGDSWLLDLRNYTHKKCFIDQNIN